MNREGQGADKPAAVAPDTPRRSLLAGRAAWSQVLSAIPVGSSALVRRSAATTASGSASRRLTVAEDRGHTIERVPLTVASQVGVAPRAVDVAMAEQFTHGIQRDPAANARRGKAVPQIM